MEIKLKVGDLKEEQTDLILTGLFEDESYEDNDLLEIDRRLNNVIQEIRSDREFNGKLFESSIIHTKGLLPPKRLMLIGLGKKKDFQIDRLRQVAGKAACIIRDLNIKDFSTTLIGFGSGIGSVFNFSQTITEGILLGLYILKKYKTEKRDEIKEMRSAILVLKDEINFQEAMKGIDRGKILAEATNFTRELVGQPSNDVTPTLLAEKAKELSDELGFRCKILDLEDIKKLRMGAFLGVARGSQEPAKFIILEYTGNQDTPPIAIIGKGITFDTGGISIKPSEKMEEMKTDMAGAAAVLGTFMAVTKLKIPVHLIGIIPATENMPSGTSMKPGDVLISYSGKTIEVISTDAEGRLILADAISYAKKFNPASIIDLATLTGACVIALGNNATGILGNDRLLIEKLKNAGEKTGERLWELPLWEEYDEQIKSDIADVKNTGGRPAGTITAAAFIKKFVDNTPWAHLDIAGTAWIEKEKPYIPKGATGVGVRLLTEFLSEYSKFQTV